MLFQISDPIRMQKDAFFRIVETEKRASFIKQFGSEFENFPVHLLIWHTAGFCGEKRAQNPVGNVTHQFEIRHSTYTGEMFPQFFAPGFGQDISIIFVELDRF